MKRFARLTILCFVLASLLGCSHAALYKGDGKFTDNGFMAYSRRFVIDLGPIDLSKPEAYTYSLSGLPRAEFVVAIQVTEGDQNKDHKKRAYSAVVRVQLRDGQNQTAIDESGPLNSWVRSYGAHDHLSELYRIGEGREIPLPDGGSKGERVGVKASGGWGTYFYSEPGEIYRLKVEVLESSMSRPARIVVAGWSR